MSTVLTDPFEDSGQMLRAAFERFPQLASMSRRGVATDGALSSRSRNATKATISVSRELGGTTRATGKLSSRTFQTAPVPRLSAAVAHEINQPLAAILSNAHACQRWLSTESPNLERARLTVDRIIRDGKAAAEIVQKLRTLFRRGVPSRAPLDLNVCVAESLDQMAEEIRLKTVGN
jgi:C4-dicarboxylate-specific signal transduction histidine kinase